MNWRKSRILSVSLLSFITTMTSVFLLSYYVLEAKLNFISNGIMIYQKNRLIKRLGLPLG